jgi:hypothetical protein
LNNKPGHTERFDIWLDKDVRGRYQNIPGKSLNVKDAWKAALNTIYSF